MASFEEILQRKKQEAAQAEASSGSAFSTWGFVENLFGGVGNIAKGLGTTIGRSAWDSVGELGELTTGYEHDSKIDDMLKAAPGVIAEDYKQRYGQGLDQFMLSTYEDPTAALMDVTTLLTLGGTGAVQGAKGASKVGGVADDLARMAGGKVDDVGLTARAVDKIIPGRKFQIADIKTPAGEAYPLGGIRNRLNQITGAPVEEAASSNPFRRLFDDARTFYKHEDVGKLRQEKELIDAFLEDGSDLGKLPTVAGRRAVEKGPTKIAARRGDLERLLTLSDEFGTERMLTHKASEKTIDKVSARIFNESGSSHVVDRGESTARYTRINRPLVKEYGEETVLAKYLQFDPHQGAGRADIDTIRQAIADPGDYEDLAIASPVINDLITYADSTPDPVAADKVRRLVEIVAGEPLADRAAGVTDDIAEGMNNVRLVNLSQEAKALMEGGYAPEDIFDHLYESRRVQYAHENGIPVEEAPDALTFDDATKNGGFKAPVYYPQPSTLTVSTSSYVRKTGTRRAVSKATPSSTKKYEGKNLIAFLKGTNDAFETNPVDAYSRLAAEWIGYRSVLKEMDKIRDNFGVKFTDEASIPDGWVKVNPGGIRVLLRKDLDFRDQATRQLAETRDMSQAIVKTMKQVFSGEAIDKDMAELVASKNEVFAVPEVVAKNMDANIKSFLPDGLDQFARLYVDPAMDLWRIQALYTRPAFYINNTIGNGAFMKLQGASLTRMVRQLDKGWRNSLKKALDDLGVRNKVESGFYDTAIQRSRHLGKAADTKTGQLYTKVGNTRAAHGASRGVDGARRLSGIFEDSARREAFLTAAEKDLMRRGVMKWHSKFFTTQKRLNTMVKYGMDNPRAVERWLDDMNDVMNNYQNLGPFERKVIKRFLIPFWPFWKHAAKTLVTMPVKHPVKSKVLEWINTVDTELDTLGPRPEWLEGAIPTGPGDQPGEERFLSTRGANPLSGVMQNFLGNLGPIPQTALAELTGENPMTGKPFTFEDVYRDPVSGQQFQYNPETGKSELMERRLGGLLAPAGPDMSEHLFGLMPLVETIRNATGEGSRYSGSGEVIRDDYGNPLYPSNPVQELLKLLGVSLMDFNLTDYQQSLSEAERRATGALGP